MRVRHWISNRIHVLGLIAAVCVIAWLSLNGNQKDARTSSNSAAANLPQSTRATDLVQAEEFFRSGDFVTAAACYEKFLKKQPQSTEALLNRAAASARQGDLNSAARDVEVCLQSADQQRDQVPALLRQAEIQMLSGHEALARATLNGLLKGTTDSANMWGLRAMLHLKSNQFRAAIRDFSQVLRLDHESSAACLNRGYCHAQLQELDLARADFERAGSLSTEMHSDEEVSTACAVNLSLVHLEQRHFGQAIAVTSAAIDSGNRDAVFRTIRAAALSELGHAKAAAIDLRLARTTRPEFGGHEPHLGGSRSVEQPVLDEQPTLSANLQLSERGYFEPQLSFISDPTEARQQVKREAEDVDLAALKSAAAQMIAQGDVHTAIAYLNEMVHHDPDDQRVLFMKTMVEIDSGDLKAALADANRLMAGRPDFVTGYAILGLIHARLGNHDSAVRNLSEVIRLNPDGHQGYSNRAVAFLAKGDLQRAVDDFRRAAQRGADPVVTLSQIGRAYARMNRFDDALESHRLAVEAAPQNPFPLQQRGSTQLDAGRHQEAIADFSEALRLTPDSAELLQLRAKAHLLRKDYPSALEDVAAARELAPGDAPLVETHDRLTDIVAQAASAK